MDLLSEIIECLNSSEEKKFRKFLEQKRFGKNCKRLQLLQYLQQDNKLTSDQIMKEMYDSKNTAAYFQLRRSLTNEAELFVSQVSEEEENDLHITRLLSMAKFLFSKLKEKAGWKYLLRAEEVAIASEQYDMLNLVYRLQLEKAGSEFAPSFEAILHKRKRNIELIQQIDDLTITENRLQNGQQSTGIFSDLVKLSDNLNKKIENDQETYNKPVIIYKLTMVERWKMLQQRDFSGLEKYLSSRYEEMESKGMFTRHNHHYKLEFLLMISYNLLQNRKYTECDQYLQLLNMEINRYEMKATTANHLALLLIRTELKICLGKLNEASALLKYISQHHSSSLAGEYHNYFYTNSAIIDFAQGNYSSAKHDLVALQSNSKRFIRQYGEEALMKKQLIECIIYWETGDNDYVSYRIKSFERKYAELLHKPEYEREKLFINIFKVANLNRWIFDTGRINDDIEAFLKLRPVGSSDVEFISFNAWLTAKMLGQDYYQTYVNMLNGPDTVILHPNQLKETA